MDFFKDLTYCIAHFDTNSDGKISKTEASTVRSIDVSGTYEKHGSVKSLEGIEHFIALKELSCHYNQLTSLDVSKNPALEFLYCSKNQLTNLDVSKNTALEYLYCYENQLISLDVSKNPALEWLHCYNNPNMTELWLKTGQTIDYLSKDGHTALKYKD